MASELSGTKNQPYFLASGAPAIDVDPGLVADYAAEVGNRKVGTNTERLALTGKDLWDGLEFYETDTNDQYVYEDGSWVLNRRDTGWLPLTYINGWTTANSTYGPVVYRRRGSKVSLKGVPVASSGSASQIGTLPVGFRPTTQLQYVCVNAPSGISQIIINAGGGIFAQGTWASNSVSWGEIEFSVA